MGIRFLGPLLIACAAILWGTDSFFRNRALLSFDPLMLVFLDHVLGFTVLSVWAGFRHGAQVFSLTRREWFSAAFVGICGSAIATVLFTTSFQFVNPSLPVLLQKLQPVFVILLATLLLGERPRIMALLLGGIAVFAALILSFPDLDFPFYLGEGRSHLTGVLLAVSAALLWAGATVAGKILLKRTPGSIAIFWRYVFGAATLGMILLLKRQPIPIEMISSRPAALPVLFLAFFSGLVPMILYYSGLARTTAFTASFTELVYPVSAVFLNLIFLGASLTPVQWVAGSVLLMAVTSLSL